jgi:hypothetical protein
MTVRTLFLIYLLLQLSACSSTSFFFDNLSFFTTMRLDSMFDLSSKQEAIVNQSTNDLKNWLKNEAAHESLKHLENAKNLWQNDQYNDAYEYAEKNTEDLIAEFLQAVSPKMTMFLLTLDEDNAEHYREYIRENSNEWFKYANSEDSKDVARIEQLEKWFGELTPDQKTKAKAIVYLLPNEQQIRIDNTNHWVNNALEASLSRDQAKLEKWLLDPSIWWLEDYKTLRQSNRQQTIEVVMMISKTMNEKQKESVLERIDDWINKIQDII